MINVLAAIEECILDGLKRRLLGLFGIQSTYALIYNISKFCPEAAVVLSKMTQSDEQYGYRMPFDWNSLKSEH